MPYRRPPLAGYRINSTSDNMPRPRKCRWVNWEPGASYFKPQGIPLRDLGEVNLTVDELEAVRLAHLEGLYQQQAAEQMNISRQTFGRILESAHRKIAQALVNGDALRIEGGSYALPEAIFYCRECEYNWEVPPDFPRPPDCPQCGSEYVNSMLERWGGRGRRRRGRCGRRGWGGPPR